MASTGSDNPFNPAVQSNYYEAPAENPVGGEIWCYCDRPSYSPGDTVAFHVSTTAAVYSLEIARDGVELYNVAGVKEGADPELKNEYVVIRDNLAVENHTDNFARPGTTVANIPPGENIEIQLRSYEIVEVLARRGDKSALDLQQAQTLLLGTEATVPGLEAALQQSENALSTLLGRPPGDLSDFLGAQYTVFEGCRLVAAGEV